MISDLCCSMMLVMSKDVQGCSGMFKDVQGCSMLFNDAQ